MLREFRSNLRLQALVLGILGVALAIVASRAQVSAWSAASYQRRIQSWGIALRLDCNAVNVYQTSFQPTESLIGNPELRMQGPHLPQFEKTDIGGVWIPDRVVQESFSKSSIDFRVSWTILDGDNPVDSGVFCPDDVVAWSYPDHVHYKAEDYSGHGHLDAQKKYSLIVDINKPCEALSTLRPVFILGPAPMKDLIALSHQLLKFTLPLLFFGLFLLVIAGSKYVSSTRATEASRSTRPST